MQDLKDMLEAIKQELRKNGERLEGLQSLISATAKNVMTVAELAQYLDVTEYTIYKMTRKGVIPSKKLEKGKRVYYLRNEIDEWLRQQNNESKKRL